MKDRNITINIDEETFNRIENYWHGAHFSNRSEAIRVLLLTGLSELESKRKINAPTEKQVEFVKSICRKKNIAPPNKWNFKAYSDFIDKNK